MRWCSWTRPASAFVRSRPRAMCPEGARQRLGILLSVEQGDEHRAAAHPEDIGRDRGELDVRPLQQLLHAVDLVGALGYQHLPVARHRPRGHPAARGSARAG